MRLRWRSATKDRGHVPGEPERSLIVSKFLKRIIFLIKFYNIPKELVFNADESGLVLFPLPKKTYAPPNAPVPLVAKEEKRQYTFTPVVNAAGWLVGKIQIIWEGTTSACHPASELQTQYEKSRRHTYCNAHWATGVTVLELFKHEWSDTVKPYMEAQGLDTTTTKWLVLLDVHWSHRKALHALRQEYPGLIIVFVPARCTPILQPLDVGFNGPCKLRVRTAASKWLAM